MPCGQLVFTIHALLRTSERGIDETDVRHILETGEEIRSYPDDKPFPSRLMLGWCRSRPIHVVAADNAQAGQTIVITLYEPDPAEWEDGFRKRKRP